MQHRILSILAVLGQFLALFPFIVTAGGVGFGEFVWWRYPVFYGCTAVFWVIGRLLGSWAGNPGLTRCAKCWAVFLARVGFILPSAVFCIICGAAGLHTGLLIYILPACIAGYYAGMLSAGREYTDIFTRGWFAVFFIAAIVSAVLLSFTHDQRIISAGMGQLCGSFGVLMILAAVLANQTNIDTQTRQRAGGHAVLPAGARLFNARLIAVVGAVVVGLCLFARPAAGILVNGVKALLGWILSLLNNDPLSDPEDGNMLENTNDEVDYQITENPLADLMMFLFAVALAVVVIKFRRQIWQFIRDIFTPLFRAPVREEQAPFVDEFTRSTDLRAASRIHRKTEKDLLRRYRRETDPARRFRAGYELFLTRLGTSAFPQLPTDTTTIQSGKGEKAFGQRTEMIADIVGIYDRVRYGGMTPDENELERLDRLLHDISAI